MEKRTSEIIMCLKGRFSPHLRKPVALGEFYNTVACYMADRCDVDVSCYTKSDILGIIRVAVMDYINTCDNPARFLNDYFDFSNLDIMNKYDECQRWCAALRMVQVRYKDEYVNGFNDQLAGYVYPS